VPICILYRIAIEALANVHKHAGAHLVLVRPENADEGWRVQIDDDGSGFNPNGNGSAPGHLGLTAMRSGCRPFRSRPCPRRSRYLLRSNQPSAAL
jgi:nitrate/nitrite-specific signal transduction histidine kinase